MTWFPFLERSERKSDTGDIIHSDIYDPMHVMLHGKSSFFFRDIQRLLEVS